LAEQLNEYSVPNIDKRLVVKKMTQRKTAHRALLVLLMLLFTLGLPLHTSVVNAFDAPPKDQGHTGPSCSGPDGNPPKDPNQCGAGDPINVKNGDFQITESDFIITGVGFSLAIDRSYDSQNNLKEGPFGFGWTFNYDVTLVEITDSTQNQVVIKRGDSIELTFQANSDGTYTSPAGRFLKLVKSAGTFIMTAKNGTVQRFNSSGRLVSIADRNNNQMIFAYDSAGKLAGVTDSTGRSLVINYNGNNKITSIVDPASRTFAYTYDGNNDLLSYTDPNGNKTEYVYDSIHRLTVKKDAKGVEIVRNTYGALNKVAQQFVKGGTFSFTYNDGYTRVCDRKNNCTDYYFNETGNPTKIVKPVVGTSTRTYDANQNLTKLTDENGNSTTYTYDDKGNLLTVTDANNHVTRYAYESIYNKVTSVTDPLNHATHFEYDAKGNLTKITNPLNQVIFQVASYNVNGNPLEIVDANGVITQLSYDNNGRLISQTRDGATNSFAYDAVGNLTQITLPDGVTLDLSYDSVGRLLEIHDGEGNTLKNTLDAVGNILVEEIFDKDGNLTRKRGRAYDSYDRLSKTLTADNRQILFNYDNNDNLIKVTDALNQVSQSSFDGVDRLTQMTDALAGITQFAYDKVGRLTKVIDPKGLATQYNYDKVGNLLTLISPDTGQTTNTFDAADNLLSSTDARGVKAQYHYDALNRLIGIDYPDSAENIALSYDDTINGNNGIGRLTSYSDQSGNTQLNFDTKGQLINETRIIEAKAYITAYQYDDAGKLIQMSYPSGRKINYEYDPLGRIKAVNMFYAGITKTLVRDISYLPFGPMQSLTYGNGLVLGQTFDQNYRLQTKEVAGISKLIYRYSAVDNITALTDEVSTTENQTFGYDKLSRLTSAVGRYGSLTYNYDKVGNRLTETDDGEHDTYNYMANSHRLNNISGSNSQSFTYDEAGNTSTKGDLTFTYYDRGRLAQAVKNGLNTEYLYNAKGERVVKKVGDTVKHFHYDSRRLLIAETAANGNVIREYVYSGRKLVAIVDPSISGGTVYYVHDDHLGTPKVLTATNGQVVWKAFYEPFGQVNFGLNLIKFNIRFPGQYYDEETGLSYNYFRNYDSSIARYIQSDFIGLKGGLNTYVYVESNPVNWIDILGLDVRYENTTSVGGWHQRVSVDIPGGKQYGQSFGRVGSENDGSSTASSAGDPVADAKGEGMVYEDSTDPTTKVQETLKTTPSQDEKIIEWLKKQRGNKGPYHPFFNSCRHYSDSTFDQIGDKLKSGDFGE
jgi:RHS repeat-associated protein